MSRSGNLDIIFRVDPKEDLRCSLVILFREQRWRLRQTKIKSRLRREFDMRRLSIRYHVIFHVELFIGRVAMSVSS